VPQETTIAVPGRHFSGAGNGSSLSVI